MDAVVNKLEQDPKGPKGPGGLNTPVSVLATMPPDLGGNYTSWSWLGPAREASRVARAQFRGQPVAVRVTSNERAGEAATELALLASVRHFGLAELLDHGSFGAGRGLWVTRSWIEGTDLATWSNDRAPEAIATVIARAMAPLHALHRAGFVHGDIKAANIIVALSQDGPRAVLTDFGMSGPQQGPHALGPVSGSLFHLAPEVLLGGARTSASDLFAVGVMLHELLLHSRSSARDFYGRFPREDYFAATRTRVEDLPAWSRDIVGSLLERDPARRPSSAARVGGDLASRLGIEELALDSTSALAWPTLRGREQWLERLQAELEPASSRVQR